MQWKTLTDALMGLVFLPLGDRQMIIQTIFPLKLHSQVSSQFTPNARGGRWV